MKLTSMFGTFKADVSPSVTVCIVAKWLKLWQWRPSMHHKTYPCKPKQKQQTKISVNSIQHIRGAFNKLQDCSSQ